MIIFANAKINLGLFILSKREDGYHDIASLKFPIPLYDVLEILPAESFELTILGKTIDGDLSDNLIFKAYSILKEEQGIGPVRIVLQKNIPMGAGIGGGSADATFTLKGLNTYFQLNLSDEVLKEYAGRLGSDCPFFVENIPQLATGKGDILRPFELDLKGKFLYLVHPNIHIRTATAYAQVKPTERNIDWEQIGQKDFSFWRTNLKNDFEDSVFPVYPELYDIKQAFYQHGAVYASMSGSGSSVFGIFEERPERILAPYATQFILEL